ncbi:uncharacterized protein LOC116849632 [Odontomachus brunneus]|uniref:uncharacterized protein LOC116849632 n=1 Tax=Odontomachus brunneus TaxID=486640 RepID=UPI0013F2774C|nr:uncharacterized protein LOC116849632 [Odontomachus brunneus]
MEQQSESNQPKNWYPRTIFNRNYHNYAVVVMARPIFWEPQKIFQIWNKAILTVTVNGGIYSWIEYLENAGIDVFSDQYNEYVPKIIIAKRMDRCTRASPTIIDKLESLGSRVIYLLRQNCKEFTRALNCIVDSAHDSNMTLRNMYVFAESETDFDAVQIKETLRVSDGNIRNVEPLAEENKSAEADILVRQCDSFPEEANSAAQQCDTSANADTTRAEIESSDCLVTTQNSWVLHRY